MDLQDIVASVVATLQAQEGAVVPTQEAEKPAKPNVDFAIDKHGNVTINTKVWAKAQPCNKENSRSIKLLYVDTNTGVMYKGKPVKMQLGLYSPKA